MSRLNSTLNLKLKPGINSILILSAKGARTALQKRYADEDRQMQLDQNAKSFQDQMAQFQMQEDVAQKQLIAYYQMMGDNYETAKSKADAVIKGDYDTALSNLTVHGVQYDQCSANEQ